METRAIPDSRLNAVIPADLAPRSDRRALLILALIAFCVKAWTIAHAVTVAPDGYGFIALAQSLERGPLLGALRGMEQHPLYPAWLLCVSWPLRAVGAWSGPATWELSGQIASALAGLLLLVPLYYLGKELFNRVVAFWAAALVSLLPVPLRISCDCLSDSTYMLFAVSAVCCAAVAVQHRRAWLTAPCAIASGLAYWTRPEGLMVGVASLLFLAVAQWMPRWRWSRRERIAAFSTVLASVLFMVGPYCVLKGGLSAKQTWKRLTGQLATPHARPLGAALADLALDFDQANMRAFDWLAILGLVATWRRRWGRPAMLLALFVVTGSLAGLVVVSLKSGYVSHRHVMTPFLLTIFWSAAGVFVLAYHLASAWEHLRRPARCAARLPVVVASPCGSGSARDGGAPQAAAELAWGGGAAERRAEAADPVGAGTMPPLRRAYALGAMLLALVACVPAMARPMHHVRAAHLEAADWLATRMSRGDAAVDLCGIAGFRSERPHYGFYHFEAAERDGYRLRFVVAEQNDFRDELSIEQRRLSQLLEGASVVATFPRAPTPGVNRVLIYELHAAAARTRARPRASARARRATESIRR